MPDIYEELTAAERRRIRKLKNPLADIRQEQKKLEKPARGGLRMTSATLRHPRKKKGHYYAA